MAFVPVSPAHRPMGRQMSTRLTQEEVSMLHTAAASARGAHAPAGGWGAAGSGKGVLHRRMGRGARTP